MGMAPYNWENEAINRWEDEYNRQSTIGGMGLSNRGSKKLVPGWEVKMAPDEEGRTAGPLAFRQAIQRLENEMAFRTSPNVDMAKELKNRQGKKKATQDASERNQVINDEKRLKDSIVKIQRDLILAGRKPNNDEQKQLWELQDEYEQALKKKAFFLAQHPEGDYIGWI